MAKCSAIYLFAELVASVNGVKNKGYTRANLSAEWIRAAMQTGLQTLQLKE